MKFTLEIELGNDAMAVPEDVADALRDVAEIMRMYGWSENIKSSTIRDADSNTVGKWEVTD